MSDWTGGYVAEIDYTYGYYAELNPQNIRLAFLNNGLVFPEVGTACELGFGQGLSVNFHAAASVANWYGTDFNPAQAGFAQELAAACGSGAKLYDEAFEEFANRTDLPDFDFIGLHGIWSWISDANRHVIVNFLRRKLKVGGVLYISYNTLPGWSNFAPMRHLLTQHAESFGAESRGILGRIDGAIEFAEKLIQTNPTSVRANPLVSDRLKKLKEQNRNYVAHEYFNRDWHPMYFSNMCQFLTDAKMQYACSAHYYDHVDPINLTSEQQSFLNSIYDPMFRETTRDFMVNQQFRRDYWVKGARKLTPRERTDATRAQRVILTSDPADVPLKVAGSLGEASLSESVYRPMIDLLGDYKVKTLGQIEMGLRDRGVTLGQISQAATILIGGRHLAAASDENVVAKVRKQSDRLNVHLCMKARASRDISYLVSPVTGGGVSVSRFEKLFLLSIGQGRKLPSECAQYAWQIITTQGQTLIKDGKTLESAEENIAELTEQAEAFLRKRLPILKGLQIA